MALQCDKKFFVYSSEDGKKLSSFPFTEPSCCRWIKMGNDDHTMILALINFKEQTVKWSVNCEFELKGGKLPFDDCVEDVQIDDETNNLLFLMNSGKISKVNFPFKDTFLLQLAKVSKQVQTLLRCVDEVKEEFDKLLKLEDLILGKVTEIDTKALQKFILFGAKSTEEIETNISIKDSDVLEWKSKLKKLHAELLVSIQELSANSIDNFDASSAEIVDKFMNLTLKELENQSRTLQYELAEFLVWLEALIIDKMVMRPFSSSDERNLKLLKKINSDVNTNSTINKLSEFKNTLEDGFKTFISKISSIDMEKLDETGIPAGYDRILCVNPFILLLNRQSANQIHFISMDFKKQESIDLPGEFISHYYNGKNEVKIICKGSEVEVTVNKDGACVFNENSKISHTGVIFNNPQSTQIYSLDNPLKLTIQ